jgi:molybdenum cofactor biosynthesis enzyme MoaA
MPLNQGLDHAGAGPSAPPLPFTVTHLLDLLPAHLRQIDPLSTGAVVVEDAYMRGPTEAVLQIATGQGAYLTLNVHLRAPVTPVFRRTAHFDLVHHPQHGDGHVTRGSASAVALERIADALERGDHPGLLWMADEIVPAASEARQPHEPAYLTVDADCGARCVFCALGGSSAPSPAADDATLARYTRQVDARGASEVYVDGRDPLAYPRIVALLQHMADRGVARVHVLTPGTRLADAAFLDAVLAALPRRHVLHIPLYGVTAETHDAVTGTPGSHAQVMQALTHLAARRRRRSVLVVSVLTRQNLHEMAAIRDRVQQFGFDWRMHVVYPMAGGRRQQFRDSAVRLTDAVAQLHAQKPPILVAEAPPCLTRRQDSDGRLPALKQVAGLLPGATRRDGEQPASTGNAAVLACPHVRDCAGAPVCSGRMYAEYVDVFGWDEFVPLAPDAMPAATRQTGWQRLARAWKSR